MASATLNASLMETLVTRGGPVETHSVNSRSLAQEGFHTPHPSSPTSTATPQHSFLSRIPFPSDFTQFLAESESQDNSTSGGDATTEDEEGSVGDNSGFFLKRSAEESSHSSCKKRRKQIKPNRVSSLEEKSSNQKSQSVSTSEENSFCRDMANSSRDDEYEALRCPHCHLQTSTENELRHHIIEDHIGRMLSEEGLRASYERSLTSRDDGRQRQINFPYQEREEGEMTPLNLSRSWAPRSQSHVGENGDRSPESGVSLPSSLHISSSYGLPSLVPLGPPPFLLPFLQQHQQHSLQERERLHPTHQPLRPVSNGQPQIFNLEAYCDLCNKEFCNKYFLKTHKANKHGIYSPDICSSQLNLSGPPLSTLPAQSTPSSIISTSAVSSTLTVPSLQTSPHSAMPIPGSPFAGAFIAANMSNLPLRPLLPPHLHHIQKNQLSLPKNELGATHSKNGVINIEAYCEICQKEFCNKYFLKRHKSKIHNIDIEVTIKNTSKSPTPLGKSVYDRPEGWCDACKKDIGSRNLLNNHKLHVHGPHIIIPMSSPKEAVPPSESSQEPTKDFSKVSSPTESVNDNFSPWDAKRDEKRKENSGDDNNSSLHSMYYQEENFKLSSAELEREREANEDKERREYWEERQNQLLEARRQWKEDGFDLSALSPNFQSSVPVDNNINIKEEPHQFGEISDHQAIKSHCSRREIHIERTNTLSRMSADNSSDRHNFQEKSQSEKENDDYRNFLDESRNSQTPIRETISDQPQTPGADSSTDENSREQGLIARVGQPSSIQVPPGTKFTSEQLRQLGVINPDAFCELCCKEFCNKYFLRTHRIKKHGIYTPEYSERSKNKDHSPISLARILERQALEMRSGLSEFNSEVECDLCRRSFPSPYLLQMHKYYIHGPGQEILHKEQMFQLQQQPFQHEHLRQLALHVQQQKMQPQMDKEEKILPQSLESSRAETLTNHMLSSSIAGSKYLSNEEGEILKVPFSRQNSESGSSHLASLSPQEPPSNRNSFSTESPQEPDTSEGLKKLQSMILELNRQGDGNSKCKICQRDVGNKYVLRAHLMTEHGILPQSDTGILNSETHTPKTSREGTPISSPSSTPMSENQGFCNICKKDFFSRIILQQHQLSSHGVFTPTSFIERIRAEIESRDDRKMSTNSRSYCEICNKELCNKYFMKTHMLKMHGINIENGTSGGVTCDICRKELCSKYFLKVHKQNSHGLVEDISEGECQTEEADVQICPVCSRKFKNLKWLQTHLNSDHGEDGKDKWREIERSIPNCDSSLPKSHICNVCGQHLPDLVALHVHFIKNHGTTSSEAALGESSFSHSLAEDMKMNFGCSVCHISFSSSTSLQEHEKSHNSFLPTSQVFQCTLCSHALPTLELYQQHLLHHQIQGILNPFIKKEDMSLPANVEKSPERHTTSEVLFSRSEDQTPVSSTPKKRWRCYECGQKFKNRNQCLIHVQLKHNHKPRGTPACVGRSPCRRKLYRCKKCGAFAKSHSTLKKHVRRQHQSIHGVPTSHAQPSRADGQFVMQPFLLNKEGDDGKDSSANDEQPFVPSLVYLPVARKVQRPLTVSFCLTPA